MDYEASNLLGQVFAGTVGTMYLVFILFVIAAQWKVFVKAGLAGWKCLIPIYGQYCLSKIVFGNGWYFIALFVPILNIVFWIVLMYNLAKVFGKGVGFFLGLVFLAPIFLLILGFGDAVYRGPVNLAL